MSAVQTKLRRCPCLAPVLEIHRQRSHRGRAASSGEVGQRERPRAVAVPSTPRSGGRSQWSRIRRRSWANTRNGCDERNQMTYAIMVGISILASGRNFNVHPLFSRNVLGDGGSHRKVAAIRVRAPGSYKAEFLGSSRINSPWRFTLLFEEMLFNCERTVSKLTRTVCVISRRPSEVLHRTNLHVLKKSLAGVRLPSQRSRGEIGQLRRSQ